MKENLYAKEILKNIQADNLDLSKLVYELFSINREEEKEKKKQVIKANEERYVGRYFKVKTHPHGDRFPECWSYYKVISANSYNIYNVECLIFEEYPTYWFTPEDTEELNGYYIFSSFFTDCVPIKNLQDCEEISMDEYWQAAKKYLGYLSTMEWPSNHWKYFDVWPHDQMWKHSDC